METLMTVLKKFWPNYKLKKIVNKRKSASHKQDCKDISRTDSCNFYSEQFTTRSGYNLELLKFLLFCHMVSY